jgi:NitT/TauT family transport system substrate-binding protein/sulfonate transport system substrate-binding protein
MTLLLICFAGSALAADVVKLKTAWMDEHETFLVWYAHEKGWDKEEGIDLNLLYFDSGMAQLNALPAGEWVLCGTGAVPAMMGNLRYDTYAIAIGNDESYTNGVMVRKDSPILKTKGWNKDYPEVYGHPDDVRGKTILATTVSSSHFALSHWLRVLGLKDSDVVIKNMDQAQALAAFTTGIGDAVSLWAPHMYVGEEKGWIVVGTPNSCGVGLPITLIADKKWADANPELVAKFLRVYLRVVNMLKSEPLESIVPEYRRFFLEWAGKDYSAEMSLKDLQTHPVFNYEEQIKLFDASAGQSTAQKWHADIAVFFADVGRITKDELKKVGDGTYATDKFLKLVQQPIPPYK